MSTKLLKWKIYCTSENQYEYVWQETSPTTCPKSEGHSVDLNRVAPESDTTAITLVSSDSPYNLAQRALLCNTTSGNITINLPPSSRSEDAISFIQKIAATNSVIINAHGSDLIDGESSKTLTTLNQKAIIMCNGTNWTSQTERANINNEIPLTFTKGHMLVDNGKELTYLPVGTDNYIMMPDSSADSGISWSNLLADSVINFSNSSDSSKKVKFDLSSISTATTRTLTLPNANDTLVGRNTADTLTTKTINANNNTITNIANTNIKSGAAIDASKIANGNTSNTEFQYINGVTSSIQTQLDGKAATSHNHSVENITSGTLSLTRGGTGQTSKIDAFNGLAPSTTKGDMVIYDGSNNIRLGVGTNDYALIADSTKPSGVKWAAVSSGGGGDVAIVQARKTSAHSITDSWTTISFNTTDVETNASTIEHDNSNTDRINILESGYYEVYYSVCGDASWGYFHDIHTRVRVNDSTSLAGSETVGAAYGSGSITSNATRSVYANFTASDYVTLQIEFDSYVSGSTMFDPILRVRKLESVGPQGPAGSGSSVILQDEGSNVTNTPHSSFNFVGTGVSVSNAGSGVATITINGGTLEEDIQEATGTSAEYTASSNYSDLNNMTLTTNNTTSKKYLCMFNCNFVMEKKEKIGEFEFMVDGVSKTSRIHVDSHDSSSTEYKVMSMQFLTDSLSTGKVIKIRYKSSDNKLYVGNRSLIIRGIS